MKKPLLIFVLFVLFLKPFGSMAQNINENFDIICEGNETEVMLVEGEIMDEKQRQFDLILNVWSFFDKKSQREHYYLSNEGAGYNTEPCFSAGNKASIVCSQRQRINDEDILFKIKISRLSGDYSEEMFISGKHKTLGKTEWRRLRNGSCRSFKAQERKF